MIIATESSQAPGGWLEVLKEQVDRLKYGVVQVVVHDRRVVQIECTHKIRFDKPEGSSGGSKAQS